VVIVSGVFQRTIKSLDLRTLSDISLTTREGRKGTIEFGRSELPWYMRGMEMWSPGGSGGRALERIENAKGVYDQIRAAQRAAA
jgi:hypothetical protein